MASKSGYLLRIYARASFILAGVREFHRKCLLEYILLRGNIAVGRGTYGLRWDTVMGASADSPVSIGSYCSIAPGVKILAGVEHPVSLPSTFPFKTRWGLREQKPFTGGFNRDATSKGPIHIGSDVWIGQSATILSGITVGDGCVVGAGAVVSRDLPPYSIAVGNPANIVRTRFSDDMVNRLIQLRWWDLPPNVILQHIQLFYSDDIERFVVALELVEHQTVDLCRGPRDVVQR